MGSPRKPFDARFLAALTIGPALNPLNSTMVAVALQPVATALDVPLRSTVWLVISLYVASAIALPTLGALADRIGPRRVYVAGLATVIAGAVIPTIWPTLEAAVTARALLGVGTSAAIPSALAMIAQQAERSERPAPPAALATVSVSALVATAVGPTVAGPLILVFGWQSIFWANIPLAAIGCLMAWRWLPPDRRRARSHPPIASDRSPLDAPAPQGERAWAPLARTYARIVLIFTGVYTFVFGFVPWIQGPYGLDVAASGLVQLPFALASIGCGFALARVRRIRVLLILATVSAIVGSLVLSLLHDDSPLWVVLVASTVLGLAQGLGFGATQNSLYLQAPAGKTGRVAGIGRTFMYAGAATSAWLIGSAYGDTPTTAGLHVLAYAMIACAAAALVLTVADRRLPRHY